MDKLQMAHEYAKIIIEKILCGDIDNLQPHEIASDALNLCNQNQTRAAEMLGISRTTLRQWVEIYNL